MRSSFLMTTMLLVTLLPVAARLEGAAPQDKVLTLGAFKAGSLDGWEPEIFKGETRYRLVESDRGLVLEAVAEASASGLMKKVEVDLEKTPYLHWSWKISRLMQDNAERDKQGDDFPARVYVVVSGGMFFWKTKALSYVWSRNQAAGTHWPNPFTENAHMVAVESGGAKVEQWVSYKRNVREDLKTYLGLDVSTIQAVALLVDTDNTGQQARSYFSDIYFTAN